VTKYFDRLREERGSVGVLISLVIFTVVGSLMMTWNTAQLSKEKMRLQNAADAAALGFCIWQARGMNAIQNINDEMYLSLELSQTFQNAATVFEGFAAALEIAGNDPFLAFLKVVAIPFHLMGVLTGGISGWLATKICRFVLVPAGYFYAYASVPLGFINAQQFAAENTADPIGNVDLDFGSFGKFGLYALGISFPIIDTVMLPVERIEDDPEVAGEPWKCEENEFLKELVDNVATCTEPWHTIHSICGTGEGWEYKPWQSKKDRGDKVPEDLDPDSSHELGRTPGPVIFFVNKYCSYDKGEKSHIPQFKLDLWTGNKHYRRIAKMPMFALAAAQCIAGDIVPHSMRKDDVPINNRMAGFGVGATAKLVPIEDALKWLHPKASAVAGHLFYH